VRSDMLALPSPAAQGNPLAQVWVVQAQGCTLCVIHCVQAQAQAIATEVQSVQAIVSKPKH
jgi:hypothetical protein